MSAPREAAEAVLQTVYDPCCGTRRVLAEAYNHLRRQLAADTTPRHLDTPRTKTFFGREKENLIYPVALANLVLHEIDRPNIWHGNTLTGHVSRLTEDQTSDSCKVIHSTRCRTV